MSETWWWGTYPEAGAGSPTGSGEGIWLMAPGGPAVRAIELEAPVCVVAHPDLPVLYAVTDAQRAELVCLDVSDVARPAVLDRVPTGGSGARHLLLSRDTLTAYITHPATGDLAVLSLRTDGRIATEAPTQMIGGHATRPHGTSPAAGRPIEPCANAVGYAPTGTVLLACDEGADLIARYEVLAGGSLRADGAAARLPSGWGPRGFTLRHDTIYVACEKDGTLATLRWDPVTRTATLLGSIPVTPVPSRSGEEVRAARLLVVSGVLLVSVVGADVIAVFDLGGDGLPTYRASFDAGGAVPGFFGVTGEQLVVGNRESHRVSVFDLADVLAIDGVEERDGFASLPHADVAVPSPTCVAFG